MFFFSLLLSLVFYAQPLSAFELAPLMSYGPPKTTFRYSGIYWTGSDQPVYQGLSSSIPITVDDKTVWSIGPKATLLSLGPQSLSPQDLWNFQVSLNYSTQEEDESGWFGNFQPGSASDKPFSSGDVVSLNLTVGRSLARHGRGRSIYLINYSNQRSFLNHIPLPGFAYLYSPTPSARMVLGFPFISIYWTEFSPWTFSAFLLIPSSLKAKISYRIMGPFEAFMNFDWSQESYLLSDRGSSGQKLYYEEKKAALGVRGPISKIMLIELALGRAMDRDLYRGTSVGSADGGKVEFADTWFVQTTLDARL